MKGLCRTANSCKPDLIAGAVRGACNGLCTAAKFHTVEENPCCILRCPEGLDCLGHYTCCAPPCSTIFVLSGLAPLECISLTGIFNDLLFKIAVRSDRLFILVSGFLDAFFTALDLRRTNRGTGLNFKELMYGRMKMMTVLCPAWAHTYQTMCLGFLGLQPRSAPAFCFSAALAEKTVLHATCRTTTRMTGIESPGWKLFTDGGLKL